MQNELLPPETPYKQRCAKHSTRGEFLTQHIGQLAHAVDVICELQMNDPVAFRELVPEYRQELRLFGLTLLELAGEKQEPSLLKRLCGKFGRETN